MGGEGPLLGRDPEQQQVHRLIANARNGRGGALLLVGEPGIGKTTLLRATTGAPAGFQVLRADGHEAESTMPYAALHRLMIPLRDFVTELPERHQQALRVATGSATGPPPDRFLVGLGTLGLLAAAGEVAPVACAVDDSHFLDSESLDALAFVARRLEAESAVLVFASRDVPELEQRMAGVPTLRLSGLPHDAAVRLLASRLPDPIDPAVATQIAAATRGNPLALTDLAVELSVARLAESSFADEPVPVGRHLESHYLRRVRLLSDEQQRWLLVAAADSTGNLDMIRAAAESIGIMAAAGEDAETAGLVELDLAVRFRHPLVRAAVYGAAPGAERRRVHAALAGAAADLGAAELEAWHAAKATVGTDAEVADRLEGVADLAGRRGGFVSRANVLVQAAALTPDRGLGYARLVAAAEAALAAGVAQFAKGMLDEVDEDLLDPLARGRMVAVRASVAMFTADPALRHATADMLVAARAMTAYDLTAAQDTLIQAMYFLLPAERLATGVSISELGARLQEGAELQDGTAATILRGLAAHLTLPYAQAVPLMRQAVREIITLDDEQLLTYGAISLVLTSALWDAPAMRHGLQRTAAAARDLGSLRILDLTLWSMSLSELRAGTPRRAVQCVEQVRDLRRAIGYQAEHVVNPAVLAWTGAPQSQVEMFSEQARAIGMGGVHASGITALAVRDLAEGSYESAFDRLRPFVDEPFLQVTPLEYADFVEAAVRSGRPEDAHPFVERLEELAAANGSPWTAGVAARSRALVDDGSAEEHFTRAVAALEPTEVHVELARTHLLFGEWLRRARRRKRARDHLRRAVELFEQSEAPAFAERARHELGATGETPREPGAGPGPGLTTQELTVARLARSGHTNAEIGATMFLSVNTVDYHLRKVFQKLGISSRRQLSEQLRSGTEGTPAPDDYVRHVVRRRRDGRRVGEPEPRSTPCPLSPPTTAHRSSTVTGGTAGPRSSSATGGRSTATRGRRPRSISPSTDTGSSPTTDAATVAPARPGTATRWTPTPTTWPAWSTPWT